MSGGKASDIFKEHHAEIRRRQSATCDAGTTVFNRIKSDKLDDPFVHPEQRYVVFSLSHSEFAPRSTRADNPAVCLHGLFESVEESRAFAALVQQEHPSFSVLIDETHKWILAASSPERLTDATHVSTKREAMLGAHFSRLEKNKADFDENVKKRQTGEVSCAEQQDDDAHSSVASGLRHKVSGRSRVEGQSVICVSFIKDGGELPEFLFRVYSAHASEDDANQFVCNVCGDYVQDFDIDMVSTASWVFPQQMHGRLAKREVFRSDELNRVMQTHRNNPQEVAKFYRENPAYADSAQPAEVADDDPAKPTTSGS